MMAPVFRTALLTLLLVSPVFQAVALGPVRCGGSSMWVPLPAICLALAMFTMVGLWWCGPRAFPSIRWERQLLLVLVLAGCWSVTIGLLGPAMWSGIEVYHPRLGIDEQVEHRAPLAYSSIQISQTLLFLLGLGLVAGALLLPPRDFPTDRAIDQWFGSAILVACLFLCWQALAPALGVGVPDWIHSNAGYRMLKDQIVIGQGTHRLNGSFSESSYAGAFLAACGAWALTRIGTTSERPWVPAGLAAVAIPLLVTTTSRGAVLGLVIAAAFVLFLHRRNRTGLLRMATWGGPAFMMTLAFFFAMYPAMIPGSDQWAQDKALMAYHGGSAYLGSQSSLTNRSAADVHAVLLFLHTDLLGVGLGSNRPSSALAMVLSCLGLPGLAALCGGAWIVLRRAYLVARLSGENLWPLLAALGTLLLTQILILSDVFFPLTWSLIALIILKLRGAGEHAR